MIETNRLILRPWRNEDRATFAAMSRDPRVMATLGPLLTRAESDAVIDRLEAVRAEHGFTFWAVAARDGAFLGLCGFKPGPAGTPIAGEVEIGWRLAHAHWSKGFAREAAAAALAWAWAHTAFPRIAAITTPGNVRSWGLMERLGMTRVADADFDHPALAEGEPLRRHITYMIERPG